MLFSIIFCNFQAYKGNLWPKWANTLRHSRTISLIATHYRSQKSFQKIGLMHKALATLVPVPSKHVLLGHNRTGFVLTG